jgi:outer membrane lipoprotein SlyB
MRAIFISAVLVSTFVSGAAIESAQAKGCIKGALVGGIAGHAAGHGVLGAVGGCVAGRAVAKRAARMPGFCGSRPHSSALSETS